jgi:hypothetical protein
MFRVQTQFTFKQDYCLCHITDLKNTKKIYELRDVSYFLNVKVLYFRTKNSTVRTWRSKILINFIFC